MTQYLRFRDWGKSRLPDTLRQVLGGWPMERLQALLQWATGSECIEVSAPPSWSALETNKKQCNANLAAAAGVPWFPDRHVR